MLSKLIVGSKPGVRAMVRKRCEACEGESFSSTDRGLWICPYCGCDLSMAPVVEAISA